MQRPWGRGRGRAGGGGIQEQTEGEGGGEGEGEGEGLRGSQAGSRGTFGAHTWDIVQVHCLRLSFSCRSHWKSPFLPALVPFHALFLASPLHLCVSSSLFPLCNFIITLIFYHNRLCHSSVPGEVPTSAPSQGGSIFGDSGLGLGVEVPRGKGPLCGNSCHGHLRTWLWTDSRAGSGGAAWEARPAAVPPHSLQVPSPPTASRGHLPLPYPSPPPVKHQGCLETCCCYVPSAHVQFPWLNPHNRNPFRSLRTHSLST